MRDMACRLIGALDTGDLADALRLVKRLQGVIRYVKIGSILFTAAGPAAIQRLRALGCEVFLDLKFHDIPSTVERSCRAAVRHGVSMLTVHASGGGEMLEAAARGARSEAHRLGVRRPRVVGVTVLTSVGVSSAESVLHKASADARRGRVAGVSARVVQLAGESLRAGLDGVVASAHEALVIRRRVGTSCLIVCPGIRPAGSGRADQRRVASPREAVARGADFLVVGRPITEARDPRRVTTQIVGEMQSARTMQR